MKKLLLILVCLVLIFTGVSCKKQLEELARTIASAGDADESSVNESSFEESALQMKADVEYTNSYLDFSFTVPKGWWLYDVNENNFSANSALTEDVSVLDISYGEDAGYEYSFIDLVSFANLQDSWMDNHIGIDISAETLDGVNSIEGYMEYYEAYILEPDENTYELRNRGQMKINGLQYETRIIEVIREELNNYMYFTFTRPVSNNYYVTIMTSYWLDNRNAEKIITDCLSKAMR